MGFIKLDRKLTNWKYYNDPVVLSVWIHLMMESSYAGRQDVRGVELKEGQLTTSQIKLANQCGITRQQLRTALRKLEEEGQIKMEVIYVPTNNALKQSTKLSTKIATKQSTKPLTIITLLNWTKYQSTELNQPQSQPNEQPNNQPFSNHSATNNKKKDKEGIRNIKEYTSAQSDKITAEPNDKRFVICLRLLSKEQEPLYRGVKQQEINEWSEAYPNVEVYQELKRMLLWLNANPNKRKTQKGIDRFINNWLSREQDRPHPRIESNVFCNYEEIDNSKISVSDEEYESYFSYFKEEYEQNKPDRTVGPGH